MNRDFNERGRIVRIDHLHSLGEVRLQFGQLRFNRGGSIQRVGAGRELNTQTRSGLTVNSGDDIVVLSAQLNAGDIFQMDDRTIGIDPQRDLAKLLRIFKPRLGNDRRIELLAF